MGNRSKASDTVCPNNLVYLEDWLQACKGWKPAGSNFDGNPAFHVLWAWLGRFKRFLHYAGPLTEIAVLGGIAQHMPGTELAWDAEHMTFPNGPKANQYLHSRYRDGWTL